jgi:muramoyltetrapeptide carboxypeptidase
LSGDGAGLDAGLDSRPVAAFNLMTLAMLVGTPLMPDLAGHVVMLEEVSEHLYAIDRLLFHVTAALANAGAAGIRLGRISDVPQNDRPFGMTVEQMVQDWCARRGLDWLGHADIGHDTDNKIVPFGLAARRVGQ